MIRRLFALKVSIPVAAVALAMGGLFALNALADFTPGTYLDAQTILLSVHISRVSAGVFGCEGSCRSAQAGGANETRCRIIEPNQATPAACVTLLASDCTPQNAVNCASKQQ